MTSGSTRTPSSAEPSALARVTPHPDFADTVITLVNHERTAAGCAVLTPNETLIQVARAHSQDMAVAAIVAFVTFVIFDVAAIVRVNLFLDALTHRSDWQKLLVRFRSSGFTSLRVYANYEYITGSRFKIMVATLIGSATGLIGGFLSWLGRRAMGRVEATDGLTCTK